MVKELLVVITMFQLICLNSCSDTGPDSLNIAKAFKDGKGWTAQIEASYDGAFGDSLITINANVRNNQGFLRENLVFLKVPPRVGIYKIVSAIAPHNYIGVGSGYFEFEGDGHIVSESFYVDTSQINTFVIDYYNESTNELKIHFNAYFITNNNNQFPELIASFLDGQITTKVSH